MVSILLALIAREERPFIDNVIRKLLGRPGALLGILEVRRLIIRENIFPSMCCVISR